MLFTKECDYAIRIMRALSSGELISVSRICEMEHLPSAMTYKITRKREKSGFLKSCRGTNGGYALNLKLAEISLYDLCAAIDPDILLLECNASTTVHSTNCTSFPNLQRHGQNKAGKQDTAFCDPECTVPLSVYR